MTDVASLRSSLDPFRARVRGAVRRFAITLTSKVLWQLAGHKIDGAAEVLRAEPFAGIGIAARPPATGKPEAIVVMLTDAEAPVIVAIRDEKTRAAVAGALKEDETAVFTSKLIALLGADEKIELRKVGGAAAFVAMLEDLQRLKTAINNWVPVPMDGGAALKTALSALFLGPPTWPTGSKVVKVE